MSKSVDRGNTRVAALAILNDSELTAIIEAIMDGVFIYHADGSLRTVNSAGKKLLAMERQPDYLTGLLKERVHYLALLDDQGRPLTAEGWPASRILRGEELRADQAVEIRVRALDGRLVDLSVAGAPLRDATGKVIGGVAIMRDVTARRRMERRSRDALNALLEMAEALVSQPQPQLNASLANAPATDGHASEGNETSARLARLISSVLGSRRVGVLLTQPEGDAITPAASVGLTAAQERRWRGRIANAHLSDLAPDLREHLQEDEPLALDLRRPNLRRLAETLASFGSQQVMIAPMRIGAQMIGLLLLDAADIATTDDASETAGEIEPPSPNETTEAFAFPQEALALASAVAKLAALVIERERLIHERAEERAHRIALSDANQRMDEFLAIASHELKSPLTAIKANVQLANRRILRIPQAGAESTPPADEEAKEDPRAEAIELLQRTERQINRLNRLVDDLLDTSRIQAGKLELRPTLCDLTHLAREVLDEQRQSQPQRAITLDAPAQPVKILADADRVRQVITNYITNALKYSPADRTVAVRVSVIQRRARLAVRDEGPGLPADEQTRIWERFHRAPGVEQQGGLGVGLGLGLHISRSIIERLGGQIGVESAVGQGSTFWFTLPLARQ